MPENGMLAKTYCGLELPLEVLSSAAGFYIGTQDLNEPISIFLRRTGRSSPDVVAMVEENFRARSARPRVSHRPEIVAGRYPNNFFF